MRRLLAVLAAVTQSCWSAASGAAESNQFIGSKELVADLKMVSQLNALLVNNEYDVQGTLAMFQPNGAGLADLQHPPAGLSLQQQSVVNVATYFGFDVGKIEDRLNQLAKVHTRLQLQKEHKASSKPGADVGDHSAGTDHSTAAVSCGQGRYASGCDQCPNGHGKRRCHGDCTWRDVTKTCTDKKHPRSGIHNVDASKFWPARSTVTRKMVGDVGKWLHQQSGVRCFRTNVLSAGCTNYTADALGFDPFMGWAQSADECQQMCASHPSGTCAHFHVYANGACWWRGSDMHSRCTLTKGTGVVGPVSCHSALADPSSVGRYNVLFIGGHHFSGTSILNKIIGQSPDASVMLDTGVTEDEGQHLQRVFPSASRVGSLSFGCREDAYITEESPLVTTAGREALLNEWGIHWDLSKTLLVEKSPPNAVHMRFLQAMFQPVANRVFFVMTTRHPLGLLHGRSPAFGKYDITEDAGMHGKRAGALALYIVSKLTCALKLHRVMLGHASRVEHFRMYQIEHFMDNVAAGVQDLSRFVEVDGHVLQELLSFDSVQAVRVRKQVANLTNEELARKNTKRYHLKVGQQVPGTCAVACSGYTCDALLDLARADPTLNLGSGRLSCGLLEREFDCDCAACECNATRLETESERAARVAEYKESLESEKGLLRRRTRRRRRMTEEDLLDGGADREPVVGGRDRSGRYKAGRGGDGDGGAGGAVGRAGFTGRHDSAAAEAAAAAGGGMGALGDDDGDEVVADVMDDWDEEFLVQHQQPVNDSRNDHRRGLFLWGSRTKMQVDHTLTWNWLPEWQAVLENFMTPTSITEDTIVTQCNQTELSWWVWAFVFERHAGLLDCFENEVG
jgi:hypothetical protein